MSDGPGSCHFAVSRTRLSFASAGDRASQSAGWGQTVNVDGIIVNTTKSRICLAQAHAFP